MATLQDILRRSLANEAIQLATINSPSEDSKYTGVWTQPNRKIASIGVQVQHRVTSHGFSLNVHEEALEGFRKVVACGLPDVQLTCIDEQLSWLGQPNMHLSVMDVAKIVSDEFVKSLGYRIDTTNFADYESIEKSDGSHVLSKVLLEHVPIASIA